MRKNIYSLLKISLLFSVLFSPASKSWALSCKLDTGYINLELFQSKRISIPLDAPNTIIWESAPVTINAICQNEPDWFSEEEIYIFTNSNNSKEIAPGIKVGFRYNGQQYDTYPMQKIKLGIKTQKCKVGECEDGVRNQAILPITFTYYLQKYRDILPSDSLKNISPRYEIFRLDGVNGTRPGRNLSSIITGLDQTFSLLPCTPDLKIFPSTVDFPNILQSQAELGKLAKSANFSLKLTKTCTTPYNIQIRLTPITGTAIDSMLVPTGNQSAGIYIRNANTDEIIPLGGWKNLTKLDESLLSVIELKADLVWRTNKATTGPFNAAVTVDLFYN